MKLSFGQKNFVRFDSENDFFIALGFLSNPRRSIRFDWEEYDNKWGIEGRIWIGNSKGAPYSLAAAFSAGTPSCMHRLNCNEYLIELISMFGVPCKKINHSHYLTIKSKVPIEFLKDFMYGYNL